MKKILFSVFCLSFMLIACSKDKQVSQEVVDLNKQAVKITRYDDSLQCGLELLNRTLEIDSTFETTYYNKINILERLHRYEDAIATLDQVIAQQPDNYLLYLGKGLNFERLGDDKKAKEAYKKSQELYNARKEIKVNGFLEKYFLRYILEGVDTPKEEVISEIPESFTEEERELIIMHLNGMGSFKNLHEGLVSKY